MFESQGFRQLVGGSLPPSNLRCIWRLPFAPFPQDACPAGHIFSRKTFAALLHAALGDRLGVLAVRCPEAPACNALIPPSMWERLSSKQQFQMYRDASAAVYVRASRALANCPAPDCDHVLQCTRGRVEELDVYEASCGRGHVTCFGCSHAGGHRPASCTEMRAWQVKVDADGANAAWLATNTKPCPNCRKPIEKNMGCNWCVAVRETNEGSPPRIWGRPPLRLDSVSLSCSSCVTELG